MAHPQKTRTKAPRSFDAFLSHRYKSPAVNHYFFTLFEPVAEVQFRVDSGEFPINVTRLERQIRSADAFVGIYPYPADASNSAPPSRAELVKASQYFRLELDLATRSHCPAIVFVDEAYGPTLPVPPSMMQCLFDSREVLGTGESPNAPLFARRFGDFSAMVASAMESRHVFDRRAPTPNLAGLLLPSGRANGCYTAKEREVIRALLNAHNFKTTEIDWSARLDAETLAVLDSLDLVITDIGDWPSGHALVSYLHGRFVPMLRLRRLRTKGRGSDELAHTLFGGLDVGYSEDIVSWPDLETLQGQLDYRLHTLTRTSRRIGTSGEALDYFHKAARRKEGVFLSYSGHDREVAQSLSAALQQRFLRVFDYRDGASIRPGQPWMDEIFNSLTEASVGIPLLSQSYFESGYCTKEARFMVDRHVAGRMKVLPILACKETPSIPKWLSQTQYVDYARLGAPAQIVPLVEQSLDEPARP